MQDVKLFQPHPALRVIIRNYAFFSHKIQEWQERYIRQLPALKDHALQIFLTKYPHFLILGSIKLSLLTVVMSSG